MKTEDASTEQAEQHRWTSLLGLELAAFSVCLVAAFATGISWFVLPALMVAPLAGPLTIAYLAMSSDTNDSAAR